MLKHAELGGGASLRLGRVKHTSVLLRRIFGSSTIRPIPMTDISVRHHPNDEDWERRQLSKAAQRLDPRERAQLLASIDRQLAEIDQRRDQNAASGVRA